MLRGGSWLGASAIAAELARGRAASWPPTRAGDDGALQRTRASADQGIEQQGGRAAAQDDRRREAEQIALLSDGQITDADGQESGSAAVFSLTDPGKIDQFQHDGGRAVAPAHPDPVRVRHDPRLPHGVPDPAGDGGQLRPERGGRRRHDRRARVGRGRHQADLQPDGRRLARAALGPDRRGRRRGPVPRLGDGGGARRGGQGRDYSAPDKVVTSVKHFAAYGQPEGGREYSTTDMSEQRLRNLYLPPFKAAVDAGADTAMCSFNAINGVPGCANAETETEILKKEWGFDGFIESDYTAVAELRACPPKNPDTGPCGHGVAADGPDAGALALNAGTDSEMVSTNLRDYGKQLLAQHKISMAPARRRGAPDPARQVPRRAVRPPVRRPGEGDRPGQLRDRRRPQRGAAAPPRARWCCSRTTAALLPLDPAKKTAVIGPLGQRPARHARPVVGPAAATRTPSRSTRASRRRTRTRRSRRPARSRQRPAGLRPGERCGPTAASPTRSPRRTRPTRSCSRSARRAR